MRLSGPFQACLFFLRKDFEHKKAPKRLLEVFVHKKLLPLLFFVRFFFCFVSWFGLICVFVHLKFFGKKKINRFEIVLITSFTILLTCTPINPLIENVFLRPHFYLWSSENLFFLWESFWILICENLLFMIICENLFF